MKCRVKYYEVDTRKYFDDGSVEIPREVLENGEILGIVSRTTTIPEPNYGTKTRDYVAILTEA